MHPVLVSWILAGYKADPWWAWLQLQIQANNDLGVDAAILPFIVDSTPPTDSDSYLALRLDADEDLPPIVMPIEEIIERLPIHDKYKLLYHINRLTNVYRLYIPPSMAPDILAIAHKESHLRFSRYYEIITHFWFIHGLTKLLRAFIRHCPQCLALQTRRHPPYCSFQPIESPFVPFLTLTLDFVFVLLLSKEKYNAIISVTCKFSKRVTFIKGTDTWSAEQWANAFLNRLDLID